MFRTVTCTLAALFVAGSLVSASAQTAAPAEKPAKTKLTRQSLKDMRTKWSANKGKLASCRKEVKARGLAGDDRWFYIEECMGKS
jgi:Ni/Co efflux regulator RcnB